MILSLRRGAHVVPDEECVGKECHLLAVLLGQTNWAGLFICDDVVHERCPTSSRISKPHGLDWSWSEGKYFVPGSFYVAIHIDFPLHWMAERSMKCSFYMDTFCLKVVPSSGERE